MKFMGILAAAMLVIAPAIASADPASSADKYSRPAPGPVATQSEDDDMDKAGLYIALGAAGLLAIGIPLALSRDGSDDVDAAPSSPSSPSSPGS